MLKGLFDQDVSIQNTNVRYMRTILYMAGPISDPKKRYKDMNDDEDA